MIAEILMHMRRDKNMEKVILAIGTILAIVIIIKEWVI